MTSRLIITQATRLYQGEKNVAFLNRNVKEANVFYVYLVLNSVPTIEERLIVPLEFLNMTAGKRSGVYENGLVLYVLIYQRNLEPSQKEKLYFSWTYLYTETSVFLLSVFECNETKIS